MGNFVTTGSRVSENGEGANLVDLKDGSDEKLMEIVNDSGPIEDYVMSEGASSLLSMKQEEEEHEFHVGDFVWVEEINCHQYWPGKIYDSSYASDLALKNLENGKLLVAYFGNEDFDWCNPSQLRPFLENFKEFSKISDSRAVKEAVREIGENVARFLVCADEESLVSPLVVNSGIKEGVLVPDVRREIVLSLVLEKPGIVLEDVKSLAKTVSFSDLLEIEVLKRKISAFYRSKGRFDLAKYDEYGYILGLENKDDEDSLSFEVSLKKCSGFASKKRKCSDEVATTGSTTLRRRLSNGKNQEMVLSPRKSKRGLDDDGIEKREESNDSNHLEDSGMEIVVDLSSTPLASLSKRVKVDVISPSVESNNENGETILQTGKRERKKSKYLSPEYYTDFSPRARKSKTESEKAIHFVRLGATRPEEMLELIRAVALGTQDYSSSSDTIKEFISVYRSLTYRNADNNKIHKRNILDEKPNATQISGVELFITNDLGSTLPSKDDLIKTYKKFDSDSPENHNEKNETETRNGVREIECLKEKIEKIRSLLDQTEGVITEELKIKLEDETRNLLDKVSKIIVPSS